MDRAGTPINLNPADKQLIDSLCHLRFEQYFNLLEIRANDLSFVIDEIERMQKGEKENIFTGKLDVKRVGAFGGSLGGPSALLFNATDPRCLASANIDGSQFGLLYKHLLNKPHLLFTNGRDGGEDGLVPADWENIGNAKPYYKVYTQGAGHGNIADMIANPFLARKMGLGVGTIDTEQMYDIYNSYLLAFFDKHIKGEEQPLLDGESRFAEVTFKKY